MGILRGLDRQRIARAFRESGRDTFAIALGSVVVTWLPMACLALGERAVTGSFPEVVLRFEPHVRFLIAAPLFVLAGGAMRGRIRECVRQLLEGGYVRAEDRVPFDGLVTRARRLREDRLVDPAVAVLAIASLAFAGPSLQGQSLAALWDHFVGVPIVRFLLMRELWRWLVWASFLARVSALDLALVASHPDLGGGLGFLAQPSEAFSLFTFAAAAVIAAERMSDLAIHGIRVSVLESQLIVFATLTTLIAIAPLLPFAGRLIQLRERAYRSWSAFIRSSAAVYETRFEPGSGEPTRALEDEAVRSLAAKARTFELVDATRPFPFSPQLVVQNALAAFVPMLPVFLTQVSLDVIAPPLLELI
jgi:hypothetical protein